MHRLFGLLASVMLVIACGDGSTSSALLSDPREVIGKTIAVTSTIRTAHVRIDAESRPRNAAAGGRVEAGTIEGDVDLATGQLAARGATRDGSGGFGMIRTADAMFLQSGDQDRWMRLPQRFAGDPLSAFFFGGPRDQPLPSGELLVLVATDARTRFELREVEECVIGRCYRTAVEIGPDQVWELVQKVAGIDAMPGAPVERPAEVPGVSLEVVSDTETLRLVELVGTVSPPDTTISFRVQLSNPNGPVTIQAPPAHLVDNFGDNVGG